MKTTVLLAKKYHVKIGAHPSFLDRENFGRKEMNVPKEILTEHVEEISELIAIEQGKPIAEAITAEIYPSLSAIDFLLEKLI